MWGCQEVIYDADGDFHVLLFCWVLFIGLSKIVICVYDDNTALPPELLTIADREPVL